MRHWRAVWIFGHGYYVELVEEEHIIRTHPIGFNTERDAARAAARLNQALDEVEAS